MIGHTRAKKNKKHEHRETASCCLACRDQSALLELLWPAEVELFGEHAIAILLGLGCAWWRRW